MKLRKVPIILTLATLSVTLFTGGNISNHNSDSYALVGDGYCVVVNQQQFEQFGTGEFADLDLDSFVTQFNLKKIYGNVIPKEAIEEVTTSHNVVDSPLELLENSTDGIASSRPA